ncbi:MAG TPA: carbon monoxide dehydrogenase subunit G [Geminicoccaceae bacterium]
MDMSGEYRIPAARQKVWEALNDPEVLRASIPGCQSLEKVSDDQFEARVTAKVGPVKSTFNGSVRLSDINPPESYTISGEGKGGAAGFAKGGADVRLREDGPDETVLTYTARADVGGKLAQLGSRLIDGTAKKMADEFFSNFRDQVTGPPEPAPAVAAAAPEAAAPAAGAPAPAAREREREAAPGGFGEPSMQALLQNRLVWAAGAILLLMILVLLFR